MSKRKIFAFLRDLSNNNSKEWMDENRKVYHQAKAIWLEEIGIILQRLGTHDSFYNKVQPKETIQRINNNRRFHPDKPIYKDFFSCSPNYDMDKPSLYISLSAKDSFIGGGVYRPDSDKLKKLRAAIDYDGSELTKIVNKRSFQDFYGGWSPDDQLLKTKPRGYDEDHPQIALLRRKNFVAKRTLTQKEVLADDFVNLVEKAYLEIKPLNKYLHQAINFEE